MGGCFGNQAYYEEEHWNWDSPRGGWYDEHGEEWQSVTPGYVRRGPQPKRGLYSPATTTIGSPRDLFEAKAGAQTRNA